MPEAPEPSLTRYMAKLARVAGEMRCAVSAPGLRCDGERAAAAVLSGVRRQAILRAARAAAPSGPLNTRHSKRSLTRGGAGPRHGTRPPRGRSLRAGQSESAREHLRGSGRWPVRAGLAAPSDDVHKSCLDQSQVALLCGRTVKFELRGFGVAHGRPVIPSRCGASGTQQVLHRHPGPPNFFLPLNNAVQLLAQGHLEFTHRIQRPPATPWPGKVPPQRDHPCAPCSYGPRRAKHKFVFVSKAIDIAKLSRSVPRGGYGH